MTVSGGTACKAEQMCSPRRVLQDPFYRHTTWKDSHLNLISGFATNIMSVCGPNGPKVDFKGTRHRSRPHDGPAALPEPLATVSEEAPSVASAFQPPLPHSSDHTCQSPASSGMLGQLCGGGLWWAQQCPLGGRAPSREPVTESPSTTKGLCGCDLVKGVKGTRPNHGASSRGLFPAPQQKCGDDESRWLCG